MFAQLFLFEVIYRLKRPAVYVYFFSGFLFSLLIFGFGALPLDDRQHINSPAAIVFYVAMMSMAMMLAGSAIMGVPLYRDIEFNTKEYYLSYPITKAGYFWGRFLGSLVFVVLLAVGLLLGAWCGARISPLLGWEAAGRYGPGHFDYFWKAFIVVALPNIFFTSALFFGLVAVFRSVKVIYSSGIILFLGYMIANFFINASSNTYVIFLADPFAINGIKFIQQGMTVAEKNSMTLPVEGLLLVNRLIWGGLGIIVLALTYSRFSFEKFFSSNRRGKKLSPGPARKHILPELQIDFKKSIGTPYCIPLLK